MGLKVADMVTQFTLYANKLHCYSDFNAQEKPTKLDFFEEKKKNQRVHVLYLV